MEICDLICDCTGVVCGVAILWVAMCLCWCFAVFVYWFDGFCFVFSADLCDSCGFVCRQFWFWFCSFFDGVWKLAGLFGDLAGINLGGYGFYIL